MDTKADALASSQAHDLAPVESAIKEIAEKFRASRAQGGVTAIRHFPSRQARVAPFPSELSPRLVEVLRGRGFNALYTHQALAFTLASEGKDLVVVTPTASGKTLCYNLPILNQLIANPEARALYLFPTKALSQDQLVELNRWTEQLGDEVRTFTYDGDTPQDARQAIRARGNLVITNPDMLHAGILPHHTKWQRLFENLRYVVIDELHYYRGVLGSHLGNVLRRLKRVARFYGSKPQFICTSATIANPQELAARILEQDVTLIDDNGAPAAEKYFLCYNPPVVNAQLGIRRSYLNETRRLAKTFLARGLQTIIFANSRLATEILVTYLQEDFAPAPTMPQAVRGYRGGYLPLERREIERDLRSGRLRGVVATSALELGIDVGSLDVALLAGYPGTIASTWQRAGRVGRRQGTAAAVLIASSAPLDQFMVQNPEYFFGRSPEHGYVNPDNLLILLNHLKCAAFELPLRDEEKFGALDLRRLCQHLQETGFLHHTQDGWHWVSESYPADALSLRSVSSDNFVIVDNTREPRVIGETDFTSALTTLHEKAIYIQDGAQYHVERLDYDDRKAYVHEVDSEYFTDAISYTKIKILETFDSAPLGSVDAPSRTPTQPPAGSREAGRKNHGEVQVNTQVVGFKKIKFYTMENIGSGELSLPEQEMHTTAFWLTLTRAMLESLPYTSTDRLDGVNGLANALGAIATLLVMCDARDLGTSVGENAELELASDVAAVSPDGSSYATSGFSPAPSAPDGSVPPEISESHTPLPGRRTVVRKIFEPNIYLYDSYPGGVGLSEPLFRMGDSLLEKASKLISECPCPTGCPSCVGPAGEIGEKGKEVALEILRRMAATN